MGNIKRRKIIINFIFGISLVIAVVLMMIWVAYAYATHDAGDSANSWYLFGVFGTDLLFLIGLVGYFLLWQSVYRFCTKQPRRTRYEIVDAITIILVSLAYFIDILAVIVAFASNLRFFLLILAVIVNFYLFLAVFVMRVVCFFSYKITEHSKNPLPAADGPDQQLS